MQGYVPQLAPVYAQHEIRLLHQYSEIMSLDEISMDVFTPLDVVLLDLDDTLMDSEGMVGSKAWRAYIEMATKYDPEGNWHDVLSLFVAQNYPVKAIEEKTVQFVEALQRKGVMVFGFTARERNKWYYTPCEDVDALTKEQINSCGIDFTKTKVEKPFQFLTKPLECFENIFFADTDTKGEYLAKLFNKMPIYPNCTYFIDDKKRQVESVTEELSFRNLKHKCYLYSATNKKSKNFDPLIANIQLYYLKKEGTILSDERARDIAHDNKDKDADFFLQNTLDLFRK